MTPRFPGDIIVKIVDPMSMQKHTAMTRGLFGISALAVLLSLAGCDKGADGDAEEQAEAEVAAKADGEASGEANVEADVEASALVVADARIAGDVTIKPADFKLDVVAEMLKEGTIESAAELEVRINDEEQGINHVDIDADGTIDHIQVIEVRGPSAAVELDADVQAAVDVDVDVDVEADVDVDAEVEGVVEAAADAAADAAAEVDAAVDAAVAADAAIVGGADVVFELRAIPSSSASAEAAVSFASAGFVAHEAKAELEIRTGFHAVVHQPEVRIITHRVPVSYEANVIVSGGAFFRWAYAPKRAVYVGTYEVDGEGRWIPPGHVKHGHWKATGEGHPGHHGKAEVHGKAKAKGSGKGSGFEVKVKKVKKGKSGSFKGGFGASAHGGASASSKGGSSKGGSSKGGSSKGGSSKGGSGKSGKDKGGKGKKK